MFKLTKNRNLKVEHGFLCSSCAKKIDLGLVVKKIRDAKTFDGKEIPMDDRIITKGSKLKIGENFIDDYLQLNGYCAKCQISYKALLEVKAGTVIGVVDNSLTPINLDKDIV